MVSNSLNLFYYVNVTPKQGGQWYYAIDQYNFLKKNLSSKFNIKVISSDYKVQNSLEKNGITSKIFEISLLDKIFKKILKIFPKLKRYKILNSLFEKKLLNEGCSVIYIPHFYGISELINKIPIIATVLDLCHLDYPNLEEFLKLKEFESREYFLKNKVNNVLLIIAESEDTKNKLINLYKIKSDKILIKYFDISKNLKVVNQTIIPSLIKKKFIFYPSNFLSHKNHKLLIEAQDYLKDKSINYVLAGNDRGYLSNIKNLINKKELNNRFFIFESLPNEEMNFIYNNCDLIVYPSLFGPANIPLFEAWYLKIPVLYPSSFASIAGDGAIYFDNKSPLSLSNAIQVAQKQDIRETVINNGARMYEYYRNLDQKFSYKLNKELEKIQ
jgi:hypothetical protein